jgi:hypothetical protein
MLDTPRYLRPGSIILGLVIAVGSAYFTLNRKQAARLRSLDPQIEEQAAMTAVRLLGWYEQTQDLLARKGQTPSTLDHAGWEQMRIGEGTVAIDTGKRAAPDRMVDAWGTRVIWQPNGETGWSLMSVGQNGKHDGGTGDDIVMNAAMVAQSKRDGVLRALKNGPYGRNDR